MLRALAALCLCASALAAQEPRPPRPLNPRRDTTRAAPAPIVVPGAPADTAARDTTPPPPAQDSARLDSLRRDTVRTLLPPLGPAAGPQPTQRRIIFDKDAIRFSGALSLGELLRLVPGVNLVRLGWFGMPELVAVAGQGAASVEIDWDGFPVDAIGSDSAGFDLAHFHIGMLSRVEVEVLPTVLRIHLVSEMTPVRRALTEVAFSTGDAQTNAYRVRYLNRWGSGLGVGLGFNYFGTTGPPYAQADENEFGVWFRGGWMSGDRVGLEYQFTSYGFERDAYASQSGPLLPAEDARRTDSFVRAFASSRPQGMGWRLDALLGTTSVKDTLDHVDVGVAQAALIPGWRGERASAEAAIRMRDDVRPLEADLRFAWSPVHFATLTGRARNTWITGGGALADADAGAELRPFGGLRLYGDVRRRILDDSTLTPVDTVKRVTDWGAGIGLAHRLGTLDVSVQRHGAFVAPAFGVIGTVVPRTTSTEATTMTVAWSLRPTSYLTLGGWYRNPLGDDQVDFAWPHHALTQLTFRSRFLPHFRRGVFDVMGRVEMESWSRGIVGADAAGAPVTVSGNTIWNVHVQFRLVGAVIYWTLRNLELRHYRLIQGFEMPRSLQRFGIMWEFTN